METSLVAIVTGAGSGIGLAVARDLARRGMRVTVSDIDEEAGRAAAGQLAGARFHKADLAQAGAADALVAGTLAVEGRVDVLVNNAGMQHVAPLGDFPEPRWRQIVEVMLTAPFLLTRAVLPSMTSRRWGRIVNVGSVHSLRASAFKAAYVSAKHGLLGLTRVTAVEGGPHGVTCNCVCPAYVRTPLVEKQIASQARVHGISESAVVETIMLEQAPVRRLLEPDEVAAMIGYLCSPEAGGVSGSALTIDCGWTAG